MTRFASRVGASAVGTLVQLNASTLKLEPGERWFRYDAPIVDDPESPFDGQPDPAQQWKTGIGDPLDDTTWKLYSELPFDPAGAQVAGTVPVSANPFTVLANFTDTLGSMAPGKIVPVDEDDTDPNLLGLLGALTAADRTYLLNRIGTISDTEASAGGLRKLLDDFIALKTPANFVVNAALTSGQPNIVLATPLPSGFGVFDPISGTGIPVNSYIGSVSADRLTIGLTSDQFTLGTPTPVNATVTNGAVSVTFQSIGITVHGLWLAGLLGQNPFNGTYTWRETPNALPGGTPTKYETRILAGIKYERSAAHPAWEQVSDHADFAPWWPKNVVAPVAPTAHHTWTSQPASLTEFLGETEGGSPPVRHRFDLLIPDDKVTQLIIGTDVLLQAGSTSSKLFLQWWDGDSWEEVTTTRVEVPLTGTLNLPKESPVGTLTAALLAAAAASTTRTVPARICGNSSNGAGSPSFGSVWYSVR